MNQYERLCLEGRASDVSLVEPTHAVCQGHDAPVARNQTNIHENCKTIRSEVGLLMDANSSLAKDCECCASKSLGTIIPGLARFMFGAIRGGVFFVSRRFASRIHEMSDLKKLSCSVLGPSARGSRNQKNILNMRGTLNR